LHVFQRGLHALRGCRVDQRTHQGTGRKGVSDGHLAVTLTKAAERAA
jgi:hypothetical protein